MLKRPWIGCDFDCTLARYSDVETNGASLGEPVPLMLERVKRWLAAGIEVRIFTARASTLNKFREIDIHRIKAWCRKYIGQELPVTAEKDFYMVELWDDRAVSVEANTGAVLGGATTDPLSISLDQQMELNFR